MFLVKNKVTDEISYLDILNDDYTELTNNEISVYDEQKQNESTKAELQAQINELDLKRIRAIAEPSLKDTESGQTWLEYYTEQIVVLRSQISNL